VRAKALQLARASPLAQSVSTPRSMRCWALRRTPRLALSRLNPSLRPTLVPTLPRTLPCLTAMPTLPHPTLVLMPIQQQLRQTPPEPSNVRYRRPVTRLKQPALAKTLPAFPAQALAYPVMPHL
jgi:hypothetical protein